MLPHRAHDGIRSQKSLELLLNRTKRTLFRASMCTWEDIMSVAKFVELSAQSPSSYEDAIREAVERASSTLRGIRSVWVKEFEAVVENEKVSQFRVVVKISFVLEEGGSAG
jgi:flavin-binding protein dodecin